MHTIMSGIKVTHTQNYIPVGLIRSTNGCCNRPFVLTVNYLPDGTENYSCQCVCGGWCTNGHKNPKEAIAEYESMSEEWLEKYHMSRSQMMREGGGMPWN